MRIESSVILLVRRLRGHARQVAAGNRHERRRRVGLDARLLEIEVRHLDGVLAVRRQRIDVRAVAQTVRTERAGKREIRRGTCRPADDVRRPAKRAVESLRQRFEIGDGNVVFEVRRARCRRAPAFQRRGLDVRPGHVSSLMSATRFANAAVTCAESTARPPPSTASASSCRSPRAARPGRPLESRARRSCRPIR